MPPPRKCAPQLPLRLSCLRAFPIGRFAAGLLIPALMLTACATGDSPGAEPPLAPTGPVEVQQIPAPPPDPVQTSLSTPDCLLVLPFTADAADRAAFGAHGFSLTREYYNAGYEHFLDGREPTAMLENEFRLTMEEQLLALDAWRDGEAAGDPMLAMQLLSAVAAVELERWPNGRPIREEDLAALYELKIDRYRTPDRVQVRIIQVPTREEADVALETISNGESFSQVAAALSRHESRTRFGEVDPFPRGTYQTPFEDVAFALEPGAVGVAETPGSVFIIQKVANMPMVQIPFATVRDDLERELRAQLRQERLGILRGEMRKPSGAE